MSDPPWPYVNSRAMRLSAANRQQSRRFDSGSTQPRLSESSAQWAITCVSAGVSRSH